MHTGSSFAAGQHLVNDVYSDSRLSMCAQTTHGYGSDDLRSSNQAYSASIRLKDLQHGRAEHSLAMFNTAKYEAIELAADRLVKSLTVTDGNAIHTPTPLKGSDPEPDFSAHKDVMNLSVGLEPNRLGIRACRVQSHSGVSTTIVHPGLSKHTDPATLCAEAKDQILEEAYPNFHMHAASMTAGEGIEANDEAKQTMLGTIKEHSEAGASWMSAMLPVFPMTARASTSSPNFDVIKGCQSSIAGTKATKEGLQAKVASQSGDQNPFFQATATAVCRQCALEVRYTTSIVSEAVLATLQASITKERDQTGQRHRGKFAHRSLHREDLLCFVLFCLACNSRYACGGSRYRCGYFPTHS